MAEKVIIHKNSSLKTKAVKEALNRFNNEGELIGTGYRNVIKILEIDGDKYNIKAFKVPNVINKMSHKACICFLAFVVILFVAGLAN